jgi:5'-nucleotidase
MAVSLEMDAAYHLSGKDGADYAAARAFTRRFAKRLLAHSMPNDVHVLNINVPADATPETPWWLARLSRRRYFVPQPPDRARGQGRPGYSLALDPRQAERDTDVWAVLAERAVSVTPLSLDLTSRTDFPALESCLWTWSEVRLEAPENAMPPVPVMVPAVP